MPNKKLGAEFFFLLEAKKIVCFVFLVVKEISAKAYLEFLL